MYITEMSVNAVNLCIGPYWNVSRPEISSGLLTSKALFSDDFYLVVPISCKSFEESLLTPFKPFSPSAWAIIAAVILFMITALRIVQKEATYRQRKSFLTRFGSILYNSIQSCTGGGAETSEKPSTAEKIIVGAFALFALYVIQNCFLLRCQADNCFFYLSFL